MNLISKYNYDYGTLLFTFILFLLGTLFWVMGLPVSLTDSLGSNLVPSNNVRQHIGFSPKSIPFQKIQQPTMS